MNTALYNKKKSELLGIISDWITANQLLEEDETLQIKISAIKNPKPPTVALEVEVLTPTEEILTMPIKAFGRKIGLPVQIVNILANNTNIFFAGQLIRASEATLRRYRHLGERRVTAIRKALIKVGLAIEMDIPFTEAEIQKAREISLHYFFYPGNPLPIRFKNLGELADAEIEEVNEVVGPVRNAIKFYQEHQVFQMLHRFGLKAKFETE